MTIADIGRYSYSNIPVEKINSIKPPKEVEKAVQEKEVEQKKQDDIVYERENIKKMLEEDSKLRKEQFEKLVWSQIGNQNKMAEGINVFTSKFWNEIKPGTFDEETVKKAQEDISEDGYWGANKTSERILDFAKSLSGGDDEKFQELKSAFEKGYKLATKDWGDELPELSKKTYDLVMKGFDEQKEQAEKEKQTQQAQQFKMENILL